MVLQGTWTWIKDSYHFLFYELADPRTNDWFLITHPIIFPIIGLYLYVMLKVGPRLMANREPFKMKKTLIAYNFSQVLVSVYIVLEGINLGWFTQFNFQCEPVDWSYEARPLGIASACHVYYMAKISELLDTLFFVLRKKNNQITFLHLYHHSVMPMISWGTTKYYPGGHGTFIGMINSFVHIIMYFYYMMSAMGPQFKKYLWWKKYITTIQLLQFCIVFLHSMQLLVYDCDFPKWSTVFIMPNAIFFYYLFFDFYKKVYTPPDKSLKIDNTILANGKVNYVAKYQNGHINGQTNGHINGYLNGYHNGNGVKYMEFMDNISSSVNSDHEKKIN